MGVRQPRVQYIDARKLFNRVECRLDAVGHRRRAWVRRACAACLEHAHGNPLKIGGIQARALDEPAAHAAFDAIRLIARDGDCHARSLAGERLQHCVAAVRDHQARAADELADHANRQARGKLQLIGRQRVAHALRRHADENRRVGAQCNATRRFRHDLRRGECSGMTRFRPRARPTRIHPRARRSVP
jgi:hypothetical protein